MPGVTENLKARQHKPPRVQPPAPVGEATDGAAYRMLALGCIYDAILLASAGSLEEMTWLETDAPGWLHAMGHDGHDFSPILARTRQRFEDAIAHPYKQNKNKNKNIFLFSQPCLPGMQAMPRQEQPAPARRGRHRQPSLNGDRE